MAHMRKILQGVADTMPYAVLWLNLKRVVLKELVRLCGGDGAVETDLF